MAKQPFYNNKMNLLISWLENLYELADHIFMFSSIFFLILILTKTFYIYEINFNNCKFKAVLTSFTLNSTLSCPYLDSIL